MNKQRYVLPLFIAVLLAIPVLSVFSVATPVQKSVVYAQEADEATGEPGGGELDLSEYEQRIGTADDTEDCGGVTIAFKVGCRDDFSNPILAYLVAILRFLTYGVGTVIILMIVIGGIQYASAGGNAQSVSAAKMRILNAFIALLLYIFAFAILNFVVPGGLIS